MRGRDATWSDPKLQALVKKFVPATDEVWRLQNRDDVECRFFQGFSEQGHYRDHGTTRQGIYCCTPAGTFLASVNTTDAGRVGRMLEEALETWKQVPKKERLLDYDPATKVGEIQRREIQYPADGLALRVYARDLPRKYPPAGWRSKAWNVDSLWYRADESRSVLPEQMAEGGTHDWPEAIAHRVIRHNLVDNVRGQTNGYGPDDVKVGWIKTHVVKVAKGVAHLTFEGESHTAIEDGRWARGVKTTMYGEAEYDLKAERFTRFELVAVGSRWGRTRYNFREDDVRETAVGFAIVLDEDDPGRRVAPAEMGAYGW